MVLQEKEQLSASAMLTLPSFHGMILPCCRLSAQNTGEQDGYHSKAQPNIASESTKAATANPA
jgi:hypothetical protein